jgi:uncharacterized repeat protein (TIGR02543 family)
MKKYFFILMAIFAIFVSCSGTDLPGDEPKTRIVFDNSRGGTAAVVYDHHQRQNESKVAEIPAGQRSLAIEWFPGESTFYFAYPVQLKGVDISLTYVAAIGQDQTTTLVQADVENTIPIPGIDQILPSLYAPLSGDAYLFIQNSSFSTFRLYQGNSEVRPDGAASAIVNAGARARYTIAPGATSGYRLLVGADFRPFPNPPANFEAGRVYNFTFAAGLTLVSEVEIKLENAVITAPAGSWLNPHPLTAGTWANGSITASTAGSEVWYSFNVTAGNTYYLWWNDSKQGNSTRTLDIVVGVVYSLSGASIFTGEDSAWESPKAFTAAANGTVKVRVAPHSAGGMGTYSIVWSTDGNVVTFNANGGVFEGGGDTVTKGVPYGQAAGDLPALQARTGYTFLGWGTSPGGPVNFTASTVVNGGRVVYAQWGLNTWTVNFNNNSGTGASPAIKTAVYPATTIDALPTQPTRTGHTFAGWNTAANGSGTAFTAEHVFNTAASGGSLTVFAQWTPITYTVVYDGNGHTGGSTAGTTHTYDARANLASNGFTRDDHVFAGWNTAANGTGTHYASGAQAVNLRRTPGAVTLYAQWFPGVIRALPGGVELAMALIPAGTFWMGSPATEEGRWDDEGPRHSVTLTRGFYMGIYPVTQEQYAAVMAGNANGLTANPSGFSSNPSSGEVQARRPVEMVRWYDALVFCNRLSIQQGLTPVYSIGGSTNPAVWGSVPTVSNATWNAVTANWNANGYRLPTEAEWEYACRAGTTTVYYTGNTENAALQAAAWYSVNSSSRTRQVGLKTPNAWGLFDMHGNVWDWVWDRFGLSTYTSAARTDPRGPETGTNRIIRGGGYGSSTRYLRSAMRNFDPPSDRYNTVGFRVVRYQ